MRCDDNPAPNFGAVSEIREVREGITRTRLKIYDTECNSALLSRTINRRWCGNAAYRLLMVVISIGASKQSDACFFQAGIALAGDVLYVLARFRDLGQQSGNGRAEVGFWQWR